MSASARLLTWFRRNARDLPWRHERSPYSVLVAEMMLQQTTVAAAAPYHQRFMARFPSFEALARAPVDDVLAAWAGLGYYRRARALHATAGIVMQRGGKFPARFEDAVELPGLGPYTAGAVLSLAMGQALPAVDGNVARVLSRWLGEPLMLARARDRRRLDDAVRALQPADRPGEFNEALMELGATTCLPRAPRCEACPISRDCQALALGRVDELPPRPARKAAVDVRAAAALIVERGRVLLARRAETESILPGLWELPGGWTALGAADYLEHQVLASLGGGTVTERLGLIRHAITHRRIHLEVYRCTLRRRPRASSKLAWTEPGNIELPLTTSTRRALAMAEAEGISA